GDLDGDGDLDVATGNNHSQAVNLLRNNGDGTFESPQRFAEQLIVFSIAAGDLDGDGDLDLAAGYQDGGTVTVLENDGTANFAVTPPLRVGPNPYHVTVADLDDDGRLDIITSNVGGNTVSILYGEGGVRFGAASSLSVGSGPVAAAPSDLNGDGRTDLAIAQQNPPGVSVLLNDGGRQFAAPVDLPAVGQPNYVTAADLDRDGSADLVLAETWQSTIAVYWNTGDGTFEPGMEIPLGRQAYSLLTADLDGDGHLDLVTANESQGNVSVLLNTGRRAFYLPDDYRTGSGLRFASAGDLDGDGDLDIVSANRNTMDLTVLLNRSALSVEAYLEEICTGMDFFRVSIASRGEGPVERVTKYVAPARDDPELLPTVFQNVARFPLHEDFLREVFSDRFPALSAEEYDQLVGRRATRQYFVGALARVRLGHDSLYTFSVAADTGFDAREVPRLEEVQAVYAQLKSHFRLEPLAYGPDTELARREAESWTNPPFPVFLEAPAAETEYQPYTLGVGYGRVRVLTLEEFEERNGNGRFTFQDVIVVDEAPRDIEGVVGGVVTAQPQGDLSHVAVRTARRGTPNA
ncbi:MAG: VCBS repeat-containing protein, partial [Actinobacteria bacterium]|nr:VCBS repeat-containing protein [Actinomycetota bacterium]